jgi:hypothetical protein
LGRSLGTVTVHPEAATGHAVDPLNKAFTEVFIGSATTPQVATATVNTPTFVGGNSLDLSWGPTDSLDISTTTPLQAGTTYDDSSATIEACQGYQSDPSGVSSAVTIDQLNVDSLGNLQSVALLFSCATNSGSYAIGGTVAYNVVPSTPDQGYYVYGGDGSLAGFGNDEFLSYLGDLSTVALNEPVVGMATTPSSAGYWMVAGDGGVFTAGDAGFYGSTGNLRLNQPVVGMAATPDGKGYWFVAADGGVFAYGDAGFYGSTGNLHLNKPIVGMAATPDGKGYWLVASDGGVFTFGDAQFYGSTGNLRLNKPIVGMAADTTTGGYWLVAADGGVFSFNAPFHGSAGNLRLNEPIVGMTSTPDNGGYWFVASDGGVFSFGDAPFSGSLGGTGTTDVAGMTR